MGGSAVTARSAAGAELRLGRWQEVLADVVEVDAVIVDAPYSDRTHQGHDSACRSANGEDEPKDNRKRQKCGLDPVRSTLGYQAWSDTDVRDFVASWHPRTTGWIVSITDHVLGPVWARYLELAGRYVFSPLAYVAPGSRVRLVGDGPSQWSTWIIVARPRTAPFTKWGTLPGAYVLPTGHSERMELVGGKPVWLMRALVRDYSRPGDLVCDPCAGAGTTLLAALTENRRALGAEALPEHHAVAMRRLSRGVTPAFDFGGDP